MMESQSETTQTVSALKLLVLKTREYELWSMRMEQYLTFTDHALCEVIVNGDYVTAVALASIEGPIPPKIDEQKLARKNELKAKSTLMLAIPDEHLLNFHACKDAKSLWEAIKNRIEGNKESKKMQKTILKQNYENFDASSQEGLDKTYDSSSTNETVNTAHNVSTASFKDQASTASYANDVMFSFISNQSNALQLDNEYFEQIDTDDLEEMDLKWQVAMLTMRVKRRGYFARECRAPRNQGNRNRDASTRTAPVDTSTTNALVVQDGIGDYDWSFQAEEELTNFALMAHTSSLSSSDTEESDSEDENVLESKEVKKTVKPSLENMEFVNARNTTTKNENKSEKPRKFSQSPRGNKRNWNALMTQKLRDGFEFKKNNCFVCGSINHLIKDCNFYENKMVLENKGKITGPKEIRPVRDNTARVNHQNKLTNPYPIRNFVPIAVLTKSGKIWRPKGNVIDHIFKASGSCTLKRFNYVDPQEIDGGFVAFRGNAKGGKITGKGKIRTGKLDFEYVYFVKELKFNLFSVSQMCDKKNSVLFTDTECVVLSPDFKLLDESQVLFKVPRNNNMYNFDLKNVVSVGGIENQMDHKVRTIRCENETEFKNRIMNEFCEMKGIMRELSVAMTPQQNSVAESKNRTLIEAARTILVYSKLPTTFWAKAVNTAYYVQNKVLVINPHNKTPYELFLGLKSSDDKVVDDAEKKSTEVLRKENRVKDPAKEGDKNDQEKDLRYQEEAPRKQFEQESKRLFGQGEAASTNSTNRLNIISSLVNTVSSSFTTVDLGRERAQRNEFKSMFKQDKDANGNRIFTYVSVTGSTYVYLGGSISVNAATLPNADLPINPLMPDLEDTTDLQDSGIFSGAYDDEVEGAEADFNNLELIAVRLVDLPKGKHAIGTKWVYRNKKDERGIVVRNKARLVAQGYTQEEGINYDKIFTPVAWIEAIGLFLAYASFMGSIVYQMDVKSAFLYDTIEEEVYVCQPLGFEDPYFPNKVYKEEKALNGLHQAPRAWYETLSTYLLENGCRRGIIDKTLFIKKDKYDTLLVQVYVDDIIFSQDKYVADILKKFDFYSVNTESTPIETNKALLKDEEAEDRIFRYLKGQPKFCLWYPKDSPFDLEAFSDSDYVGASLDRKSITGGCQFLGKRLISWQCKKKIVVANSTTEAEYVVAANCYGQDSAKVKTVNEDVQIRALVDGKKIIITEASIRCDLQLQDAEDKRKGFFGKITPLFKTMMVQALEKVGEGLEVPTDTHHTPIVTQPSSSQPQKKQKLKRKQRKEIEVPHTEPQTKESVPTTSNDPLPSESQEAKEEEKSRALGLKRLWKIGSTTIVEFFEDKESLGDQEDASKQGRMINNIDQDVEITLVDETQWRMNEEEMFIVNDLDGDEEEVQAKTDADMELAQKLQTEEQEQLTDAEKESLFMEFLEKRRNFFARKQEIKKRNRPPTKAQQRSLMCAYLKNMDGWKPKNLKKKSFNEIQKLFDSVMKRVNTFVDMNTEIVEERLKKTQAEKLEKEDDFAELKRCLEIVPKDDDDVTIEATHISSKSPIIVDYKIYKEGKKSYFKIIRADENSQSYLTFRKMFKNFNKEDLEVLWSIVKERFKKTKPVDDMNNLLF
uniref:Integrase catalytic domain-containing protein n=1 Tax=Tanacetum cinerariifolium TaxID=118510 RepID=A0A6L2NCA2_TANCI|nr:hypothetical protein [Tanacetum cinerariifolium]